MELLAQGRDCDIFDRGDGTVLRRSRKAYDQGPEARVLAYAAEHGIPIEMSRGAKSPFSMDANMLHISYEGGPLEDPWTEPPSEMWRWSVTPEQAPNDPTYLELEYRAGDIVAVAAQPDPELP